ncbi:MAG: DUF6259 domain-containing protein [Clostridiales bacterium]|nr:DUF6259 domain-containing protein [Clostridiales bacterium]
MRITNETKQGLIRLTLDETILQYTIEAEGIRWSGDLNVPSTFEDVDGCHLFTDLQVEHRSVENGVGSGIRSAFRREATPLFETFVWIEQASGAVRFEWIPLTECGIKNVCWPEPFDFVSDRSDWYTLIPNGQGLLVPNDWPEPLTSLPFDGMFLTHGCYMPWFGQVKEEAGYIAIAETPWNGRLKVDHAAPGATSAAVIWDASLGSMDYRRILTFHFRKECDYNELCRIYRTYVMEHGLAATLREKAARLPSVERLIGAAFVHTGIKTHVDPDSSFFDPQQSDKNNHLTTFAERQKELEIYEKLGVERLYVHLDGWAEPGYDNQHPDYLPACEEAGGWEGMRALSDSLHRQGYLFGIHDQYRDYYHKAPSYDADYAVQDPEGTYPQHARWAGGPQSYLCATQAPYYVRRNFQEILAHVPLDGAYLDVFTCNEGDECANPLHRMTRRECYEYRRQCFDWLIAHGILPSSEEVSDWSMRSLVFCHYAPYAFQLETPDAPRKGVPVPLFNLVYHDCVIIPWMMDRYPEQDHMLYALLNGGAPYVRRDPAYVGIDGAFAGEEISVEEAVERSKTVCRLHAQVALERMQEHHFLNGSYEQQETVFETMRVRVDLKAGTYEIFEV